MIALSTSFGVISAWAQPAQRNAIPDQYVVLLKQSIGDPAGIGRAMERAHGLALGHTYRNAVKGFSARIPAARLADVQADPDVLFVSPDTEMRFAQGKRPPALVDLLIPSVDRIEGDTSSARAGDGRGSVDIDVAVIDSGVTLHHDLNVAGGFNCTSRNSSDWIDRFGHGTFVAGAVAARDNGGDIDFSDVALHVTGTAPGARIWAVRVVSNNGRITTSDVICAVDWVSENAATIKVANMSITNEGTDDGNCGLSNRDALHVAICGAVEAGVTIVAAAGNDEQDFSRLVPAAYQEVLTVTAMVDWDGKRGGLGTPQGPIANACEEAPLFSDDTAAFFSNFARPGSPDESHAIAAPGVCVVSTVEDGYTVSTGTSFSSPYVAGAVALCIASGNCSGLTPAQIIAKIIADASAHPASYGYEGDPNQPIDGRYYGPLVSVGDY
jgi:subtilisin family serine protease